MHRFVNLILITLFVIVVTIVSSCKEDDNGNPNAEDKFLWMDWTNKEVDTTIYYVSENGDDGNSGLTVAEALKTLSKALRKVHPAGKIRILPGTYHDAIALSHCNPTEKITIEGYMGRPLFDGEQNLPGAMFMEQCSKLSFTGIDFKNYTDFGLGASFCKEITFGNLLFQSNGQKVQLIDWEMEGFGLYIDESEGILIENCEAAENGPRPQVFPDMMMGTGIDTWKLRNSVIRNNHAHHNTGGGILVEDGWNVTVEGNEVNDNNLDVSADGWWDGGIWVDGGHDILVRDNYFHDNQGPGIEISDEDNQHPYGYVLENNISTGNYFGIYIWNFGTTSWPDTSIIRNTGNDFSNNTRKDVWITK